jgi:deoxyribodipyrimidine photo-lyase
MKILIYWFRNDLRIIDNPAFTKACLEADYLIPVYLHHQNYQNSYHQNSDQTSDQTSEMTPWGFERVGIHRQVFLNEALADLKQQLKKLGSNLFEYDGSPQEIFPRLVETLGATSIYCEQIEAPEEKDQVGVIKKAGIDLQEWWQSSMLNPEDLPFSPDSMPDMFTKFRQEIERIKIKYEAPIATPVNIPPLPNSVKETELYFSEARLDLKSLKNSEFLGDANYLNFKGGQSHAQKHIDQYFKRRLPDTYKQTRNQLIGMDYSSKFSPWLALGCCSPRQLAKHIDDYEVSFGANEGSYWLWFELLWRDYFRFLHFKYGNKLYRGKGLSTLMSPLFDANKFKQWSEGNTGDSLIDAGMRELKISGYLSNRLRQVVASYWIHDMGGDWRAGCAWFESQLIDYDVYSNQGNWLYIAGRGTDPRGGRAFNVAKQTKDHDPDGVYRNIWLNK